MFLKAIAVGIFALSFVACGVGGGATEEPSMEEEETSNSGFTTGGTTGGTTGSTTGGTGSSTGGTTSSGTTTGGTTGSGLATSLNCVAGYCNQTTASCESGSIRVNWGSDGRGTTYRILKRPDGGSNAQLDVSGTTYLDSGVTRGVRYIYRVKYGTSSASNEAAATCP